MDPNPLKSAPVVSTTPWAAIGAVSIVATAIAVGGIVIYFTRGPGSQNQQQAAQTPKTISQSQVNPQAQSPVSSTSVAQNNVPATSSLSIWNLQGSYSITFYCVSGDCSYPHTMTITTQNQSTGDFSGTGKSITDPKETWTVKGNTINNTITFSTVSANDTNYTGEASGVIDVNGNLTGTFKDSHKGSFTWKILSGQAKRY